MGEHGRTTADWYPDPEGGSGVRWWDGDRWTDDTRAEHPRAGMASPVPPLATPPPGGGAGDLGRTRLVVSQVRPRTVGLAAYHVHDPDGFHLGTVVERPAVSGRREERAATLDMYEEQGGAVYRLTRDPHLVAETCAAMGWRPLAPWGYVVLDAEMAPVAWAQAPTWSHQPWTVQCLGVDAAIEIRGQRIGQGRKAPRPVTMGGALVARITLVSGWSASDTYVLDLLHGAPEGGLATTFAALVPMYDQIFREVTPDRSGSDFISSS